MSKSIEPTRGNWHAVKQSDGTWWVIGDGRCVARCDDGRSENEADASWIAAHCPAKLTSYRELLATCELARNWILMHEPQWTVSEACAAIRHDWQRVLDRLKAVQVQQDAKGVPTEPSNE